LRQLTETTFRNDTDGELERNLEYALTYKKLFDRKEHELTADFRFEGTSDRETNDIYERKSSTTAEPSLTEDISTLEKEMRYLFQLDYVHPFNDEGKFEAGLKSNIRNVNNDYYVRELGANDQWQEISNLSNNLEYNEMIHAGYLILGNEYQPFSYQIGVRGEYSDIGTHLLKTGEKNNRSYFDLFPSIHLTYEIVDQNSLQLSYSRRLRRPRHRHLNPFSGYSDSRNIRRGNPNLDPEYTNSYEFNFVKNWETGSFSSGVYYRHTNGVIQYIRTLEDTIIVAHPENLSTGQAYGFEFTSAIDLFKWWNIDGNLNFFKAITDGGNLGSEYKSETFSWFGRINSKTTLWNDIDLQLRFRYMAPRKSIQGREKASYFMDLGLSKDIFHGNGTLTLSVRDLLNSHKHENETFGDGFYSNSYFQFHRRAITLGLNYRLNREKGEEREHNGDEPNGVDIEG
jgi:ferric enterobactin receptor